MAKKFNENTARANKHTARPENKQNQRFEKAPTRNVVKALDEGALLDILEAQPQGLYLVLDCVQDPHN